MGYGGGNRFASGIMSGAAGMGALGALGMSFTRFAPMVDPIAGGMAGFAGGGMAGAAMGVAAPLALGYAASKAVGSVMEGGQQLMQTNRMLGQNFQFVNPASRTGFGFNRADAQAITGQMQQMSHLPELMTSFHELQEMVPKLRQAGVFQGVRDANEFNRRFKESITTLRDMSKVLGSTMEEAASFFQHSRQLGMTGQAATQNAMLVRFTAATTGMSTEQVMAMQQGGAGLARQMGVRGRIGAGAVTSMARQLQMGIQSGALDQTLLEDLTGQVGEGAVGAGAEQLTGRLAQMFRGTSFGRQSMFALAKFDKSGRFTGIDEERARRLQEGTLSWDEQRRIVSGLSRRQKMELVSHEATLSMQAAGAAGLSGFAQQVSGMREKGYDDSAIRLQLTKMTGDENLSDALMQMAGQIGDMGGELQGFAQRQARTAALRERRDPRAILQKMGTRLKAATTGKLEHIGTELFGKISKAYDDFWDDVFENYTVTMSKEGAETLKQAFTGTGEARLKQMFADASGVRQQMTAGRLGRGTGSDFGAWLMRGGERSESAQYNTMLERFGGNVSGLTDEARDRVARQSMASMGQAGRGLGIDQAGIMGRLMMREGAGAMFDMSGAQKYEATRNALADVLGTGTYGGIRGLAAGMDVFGQARSQWGAGNYGKAAALGIGSLIPGVGQALGVLSQTDAVSNALKSGGTLEEVLAASGGEDQFRESLEKKLGLTQEQSRGLMEAAKKSGAKSALDALTAGLTNVDPSKSMGDLASQFFSAGVAKRATMLREGESKLQDAIGPEGVALLRAKPGLSDIVSDPEKLKNIQAAMGDSGGDAAETARILRDKYGMDVDTSDMSTLQSIASKAADSEKGKSVQDAIRNMSAMQKFNDLAITNDAVQEQAKSVKGSSEHASMLKKALNAFSDAITTGKGSKEAISGVRAAYESLSKQAAQISDPEKRKAFYDELGSSGEVIRSGVERGQATARAAARGQFGGKSDLEDYLKKSGFSEEEARSLSATYRGGAISQELQGKISASAAEGLAGARLVGKAKDQVAGEKDQRLIETLEKVNKSIDGNSSILAMAFADKIGDVTKEKREKAQKLLQETTDSK